MLFYSISIYVNSNIKNTNPWVKQQIIHFSLVIGTEQFSFCLGEETFPSIFKKGKFEGSLWINVGLIV